MKKKRISESKNKRCSRETQQKKIMGATMAHLLIRVFNLDKMAVTGLNTSIDLAASEPQQKMDNIFSMETMYEKTQWSKEDRIIRMYYIPLVYDSWVVVDSINITEPIDVSPIKVYPKHVIYKGTSLGFGTDSELEKSMEQQPGWFCVGTKQFNLLDFKILEENASENTS